MNRQKAKGRRQSYSIAAFLLSAFCLLPSALSQDGAAEAEGDAQAAADLELISALERVVSRAIARAERSVVSIARRKRPPAGLSPADFHPGQYPPDSENPWEANLISGQFGTGVVVDASGLVLTNSHVLGDEPEENEFFVRTIGRKQFEMKIKANDGPSDLAVLEPVHPELRRAGDFVPITFGDGGMLKKGQIVIALGNPYGIARDGQASASWGIVANLSRKVVTSSEDSEKTLHDLGTLIQTDARLNLGTSGGALVNVRGEMVGLTTSLAATSGFEQSAGYAIPIDKAFLRIIQTLKEGREVEYGLLGIETSRAARDHFPQGIQGVVVTNVVQGGPASKAGIRASDIITHVDGKPIYDFDGLRLQISKLAPQSEATLTVQRSGETAKQRHVVLAKYPVALRQMFAEKPPAWRGATIDYRKVEPLAPGFRHAVTDGSGTACVAVREVEEGSPAWRAGLRKGMLISHVGSTPVETPPEFRKAVGSQTGPVKLKIFSAADGSKQTVVVPAE